MTEIQIERHVEAQFDRLDALLMNDCLSQAEYDAEAAEIDAWAERLLRRAQRRSR